jgi:glycosyltransferase involved in cell wall biosynthesis
MRILLLSNFPADSASYDMNLLSKVHKEIKKEIEVQHYLYVYKGHKSQQSITWFEVEMPFYWDAFYKKIAGAFFIFLNNIKLIKNINVDLIMLSMGNGIHDFPIFFYPLFFPGKNFYVETSTPSVSKSKIIRIIVNKLLTVTLKPYKKIGINNLDCKTVFKIPEKKAIYLSFGYPEYTFNIKDFQSLSLVYLGTLANRDVWKTVTGIKIFTIKHPKVQITYDIIGGGKEKEVSLLTEAIEKESLTEIITYHGYKTSNFIDEIFHKCNIGVAFVPLTEYYDKVFTTKALEYLLAGMPIIATRTSFAKGILNKDVGVLCEDTPEDFANAIEEIYNNRRNYNSEQIREIYKNYGMSNVIRNEYIPILKSIV